MSLRLFVQFGYLSSCRSLDQAVCRQTSTQHNEGLYSIDCSPCRSPRFRSSKPSAGCRIHLSKSNNYPYHKTDPFGRGGGLPGGTRDLPVRTWKNCVQHIRKSKSSEWLFCPRRCRFIVHPNSHGRPQILRRCKALAHHRCRGQSYKEGNCRLRS